jgi:peptidoglycan pentaglycine glycine transferase (the first glycine)
MKLLSSNDPNFPTSEIWDSFVAGHQAGHFLQSHPWGQLKSEFGWRADRVALLESDQIVGGALLLLRPSPIGSVAYIPRGPVVDWGDQKICNELLKGLRFQARASGACFLRIEPNFLDDSRVDARLTKADFQPASQTLQPRSTISVDLTAEEEAILSRMKPKTRYNIRLAARKGVVVREGDLSDFPAFYQLMRETSLRDGFLIHKGDYFRRAWELFASQDMGRLFLATYEDQLLGGIMVFAMGTWAWYMYGASSNQHRNLMPNYLLQWEAMRWAKERGCVCYDMWGIPDEVGEAEAAGRQVELGKGGLWGVYRFKSGFGGRVMRCASAYDFVYSAAAHWLATKVWPRLPGRLRWGRL